MKRQGKARLLAVLLCVCMLAGLMPQAAPKAQAAEASALYFDFKKAANIFVDTAYSNTDNMWKFHSYTPSWTDVTTETGRGTVCKFTQGGQFLLNSTEKWVALELDIPQAGRYQTQLIYYAYKSGGIADIYLIPATEAENVADALSADAQLGSVDFYAPSDVFGAEKALEAATVAKAGKYLLVFKASGSKNPAATNYYAFVTGFQMEKAEAALSFKLGTDHLLPGASTDYTIELINELGENVDIEGVDITMENSDSTVAEVDEAAKAVTALKLGSCILTARAEYQGNTLEASATLTVSSLSGAYQAFDFTLAHKDPSLFTTSGSVTPTTWAHGYQGLLPNEDAYYAVDVAIDVPGSYRAAVVNYKYKSCAIYELHLVPKSENLPDALSDDKYLLAEVDGFAEKDDPNAKTDLGIIEVPSAGEYRLVVQGTGRRNPDPSAWNDYVWLKQFYLDGTELGSVEISIDQTELAVFSQQQVSIVAKTSGGTQLRLEDLQIQYASSAPEVAGIDEDGMVTALKQGSAEISAEVSDMGASVSASQEVSVFYPPSVLLQSVSLKPKRSILRVGDSSGVTVSGIGQGGVEADLSHAQIVYSSDKPEIISIADDGTMTAHAEGSAAISASVTLLDAALNTSATVAVVGEDYTPVLESVSIDFGKAAMPVGDTGKARITGMLDLGVEDELQGAQITCVSSNPEVLEIANDGSYTAKAKGEADVTVTVIYNGITKTAVKTINVGQLAGKSYSYDFSLAKKTVYSTVFSDTGNTWAYHSQSPGWTPTTAEMTTYAYGAQMRLDSDTKWYALEIDIPAAGMYYINLEHGRYWGGAETNAYLLPASTADIGASLTEETCLGAIQFYYTAENPESNNATTDLNSFFVENPGKYILCFKNKQTRNTYTYLNKLNLIGVNTIRAAELTLEKTELIYGETTGSSWRGYMLDGSEAKPEELRISYRSSDESVATVSRDGIVTATGEGQAEITVNLIYNGITKSASQTVTVTDTSQPVSAELSAPETVYVRGKGTLKFSVLMESGNRISVLREQDTIHYSVVEIEPEGAAVIDENGVIEGIAKGVLTVKAELLFRGKTMETNAVTIHIESSEKSKSTIWTEEKRAALLDNVQSDSVTRQRSQSYAKEADVYVNKLDDLYNMVVAEGLPRYYFVGEANDPERMLCRYCGVDIAQVAGMYGWIVDALNHPWKIQCPDCRRMFPSNDFGSYYALGLDEHGVFQPELAKEKNDQLISEGQSGYLVNLLYPEKDKDLGTTGWGVDDGFGYFPGRTYENGVVERHNYIAYYLHWGLWYGGNAAVDQGLKALRNAYLYTGEAKYGRAGAILLDRIADFYPDFDWYMWHTFRGDSYRGKIVDPVWENGMATLFSESYDAFYPVYEDEQVLRYLSDKASRYGLENPKDSADAVRKNAEDRILKATFEAAVNNQIAGNFGTDQGTVIQAAVVLNTMPETGEWLDWVMAPGASANTGANPPRRTGGNLIPQLLAVVDRDGMGNESAPGYNSMWYSYLARGADLLDGYELYPAADLYQNPKFNKMITSQIDLIMGNYYTAQIGDSGAFASTGFVIARDILLKRFLKTGEPIYAQLAYLANGNTAAGLREYAEDTVKGVGEIEQKVRQVVEQYGEITLGSSLLTGYGLAALRAGKDYPNLNTSRDFWMYYGTTSGHGHGDGLNLGISAFGLNMAPELGYPKDTGTEPNRVQWVSATLSHNTVTVDGKVQTRLPDRGNTLHFDDAGKVQVMDTDKSAVYSQTSQYRRTVVTIEVDDQVSYGVDFFRVAGGNDHLYSFHSQSDEIFETEGLELVAQADAEGNFVGTYAGAEVPWGQDPDTTASWNTNSLRYPAGFTWLDTVRRDSSPERKVAVDFQVKDFKRVLKTDQNLHLRMTMLNDFDLSELAIAHGYPVQNTSNPDVAIEYVLARRTGKDLDSLFTTVLEPYKAERYLQDISEASVSVVDGKPEETDTVRAVQLIHTNGRVDYIVYASNNQITYRIDDRFDFRGFVGVCMFSADGELAYRYLNDGDILADQTKGTAAYTGGIYSFTEELSMQNTIEVEFDQQVDVDNLAGRCIHVENDGVENGVYRIKSAQRLDNGVVALDIGDVSLVRGMRDTKDLSKGYVYNIERGQGFRIPLSQVYDTSPVLAENSRTYRVTAGHKLSFTVSGQSDYGRELSYEAVALPRGASFDAASQTFTWTPDNNQIGKNHAAIMVSDGVLSETYNAIIEVVQASSGNPSPGPGPASDQDTNKDPGKDTEGDKDPIPDGDPDKDSSIGSGRFDDLGGYAWAAEAIERLAEMGIIKGTGPRTFSPGAEITRADFTILLVRAFNLQNDGSAQPFADVSASAYYADDLLAARAAGLAMGVGENRFNPQGKITRQDMMVLVYRALELSGRAPEAAGEQVLSAFADGAQVSAYAREAVAALVNAELIQGSNGKILPQGLALRAEVAVLLERILTEKQS